MNDKKPTSYLALLLAILLTFSFVGCAFAPDENKPSGGNSTSDETTAEETTQAETTKEETTAEETTKEETTKEETTEAEPDDFILSGFGTNPYAYTGDYEYPEYTGPQMTEEELKLDTQALIDLIFSPKYYGAYEEMLSVTAFANPKYNFCEANRSNYATPQYQYCRNFNGFLELETRPDAARLLLNKYKTSMTDDCLGEYMYYKGVAIYPPTLPVLPFLLEVLLTRTAIFSQLTEAEQRELYDTICEIRYNPMEPPPYVAEFDAVFLFFPHYNPITYEESGEKVGWKYAN